MNPDTPNAMIELRNGHTHHTTELLGPQPHTQHGGTTPEPIPVAVAFGDGIGPEIMDATLRILEAAGAPLRYDVVEVGESVYRQGHTSGISPETW